MSTPLSLMAASASRALVRLSMPVLLAVLAPGCPATTTCGPDTCRGCCSPDGTCQTGFDDSACGSSGTGCADCASSSATCNANHVCLAGPAGGGGGGAGGGGNGTGGGVPPFGVADQELISGTRLKAVRLVGSDGAQAPYGTVFWDSQLSIPCSPGTGTYQNQIPQLQSRPEEDRGDLGTLRCYPTLVASVSTPLGRVFYSDSACTQQLAVTFQSNRRSNLQRQDSDPLSPKGIFSAAGVRYGFSPGDGGYRTLVDPRTFTRANPYSGASFAVEADGGCSRWSTSSSRGAFGFDLYTLGADVPDTEFAEMTVSIDP